MKPFTVQTTPHALFDAGAAKKIATLVSENGARCVLFVLTKAASLAEGADLAFFEDESLPPSHVVEAATILCSANRGEAALGTEKLVESARWGRPPTLGISKPARRPDQIGRDLRNRAAVADHQSTAAVLLGVQRWSPLDQSC